MNVRVLGGGGVVFFFFFFFFFLKKKIVEGGGGGGGRERELFRKPRLNYNFLPVLAVVDVIYVLTIANKALSENDHWYAPFCSFVNMNTDATTLGNLCIG